jgi:hypothetical protein
MSGVALPIVPGIRREGGNAADTSASGSEPAVLREAWPDDDVYHLVVTKPVDLRKLAQHIASARHQISRAPR